MNPIDRIRRVLTLLADPRVPRLPRLAVIAAAAYLLWPVDALPEIALPIVGWLDDATFLWLTIRWLLNNAKNLGVGTSGAPHDVSVQPPPSLPPPRPPQ